LLRKKAYRGISHRGHQRENRTMIMKFLKDESGATAIEYGLIAAGISVAIIAVVQGLGDKLNTTFTSVQNALN
jgi:pilus assembly protein Flp/PilA